MIWLYDMIWLCLLTDLWSLWDPWSPAAERMGSRKINRLVKRKTSVVLVVLWFMSRRNINRLVKRNTSVVLVVLVVLWFMSSRKINHLVNRSTSVVHVVLVVLWSSGDIYTIMKTHTYNSIIIWYGYMIWYDYVYWLIFGPGGILGLLLLNVWAVAILIVL